MSTGIRVVRQCLVNEYGTSYGERLIPLARGLRVPADLAGQVEVRRDLYRYGAGATAGVAPYDPGAYSRGVWDQLRIERSACCAADLRVQLDAGQSAYAPPCGRCAPAAH